MHSCCRPLATPACDESLPAAGRAVAARQRPRACVLCTAPQTASDSHLPTANRYANSSMRYLTSFTGKPAAASAPLPWSRLVGMTLQYKRTARGVLQLHAYTAAGAGAAGAAALPAAAGDPALRQPAPHPQAQALAQGRPPLPLPPPVPPVRPRLPGPPANLRVVPLTMPTPVPETAPVPVLVQMRRSEGATAPSWARDPRRPPAPPGHYRRTAGAVVGSSNATGPKAHNRAGGGHGGDDDDGGDGATAAHSTGLAAAAAGGQHVRGSSAGAGAGGRLGPSAPPSAPPGSRGRRASRPVTSSNAGPHAPGGPLPSDDTSQQATSPAEAQQPQRPPQQGAPRGRPPAVPGRAAASARPNAGPGARAWSTSVRVACPPRPMTRYITNEELELMVGPQMMALLLQGNRLSNVQVCVGCALIGWRCIAHTPQACAHVHAYVHMYAPVVFVRRLKA